MEESGATERSVQLGRLLIGANYGPAPGSVVRIDSCAMCDDWQEGGFGIAALRGVLAAAAAEMDH